MNRQLNLTLTLAVVLTLMGCSAPQLADDKASGYGAAMPKDHPTLPPALSAERRTIEGRAGPLSYYVAGQGEPMLLVHSINAAGSAYEVRPIFERFSTSRRVYVPDLPGFGFSDRTPRDYRMALYVAAIHDMLDAIEAENGPVPVDVLALSLSSEFAARAAVERPDRMRTLAMVTPTGFNKGSEKRCGPPGSTREVPGLYAFFTVPLWSQGIYDLLVSQRSIRYFLKRTWGSDQIDEGLAAYDYLTTHQPGARHAPYAFVSGRLFSADIRCVYQQLTLPVWVPHGVKGDFGDFSEAGWTEPRGNWRVEAYDTGALPHFEQPGPFMAAYAEFLAAPPQSSGVAARSPSP
jgi:pimeloyl-ACP methyl ester carboxylesterase